MLPYTIRDIFESIPSHRRFITYDGISIISSLENNYTKTEMIELGYLIDGKIHDIKLNIDREDLCYKSISCKTKLILERCIMDFIYCDNFIKDYGKLILAYIDYAIFNPYLTYKIIENLLIEYVEWLEFYFDAIDVKDLVFHDNEYIHGHRYLTYYYPISNEIYKTHIKNINFMSLYCGYNSKNNHEDNRYDSEVIFLDPKDIYDINRCEETYIYEFLPEWFRFNKYYKLECNRSEIHLMSIHNESHISTYENYDYYILRNNLICLEKKKLQQEYCKKYLFPELLSRTLRFERLIQHLGEEDFKNMNYRWN